MLIIVNSSMGLHKTTKPKQPLLKWSYVLMQPTYPPFSVTQIVLSLSFFYFGAVIFSGRSWANNWIRIFPCHCVNRAAGNGECGERCKETGPLSALKQYMTWWVHALSLFLLCLFLFVGFWQTCLVVWNVEGSSIILLQCDVNALALL
jgi:hypothetical protein